MEREIETTADDSCCNCRPQCVHQQVYKLNFKVYHFFYLYILRGFRKFVITSFSVKNTPKLINQQLKNEV